MGRIGTKQHEENLQNFKVELEQKGYKVILLRGLSPDGVAISPEGKVCAIECVGQNWKPKKGWDLSDGQTFTQKRTQYSMFDDVLFRVFKYPKKTFPHEKASINHHQESF